MGEAVMNQLGWGLPVSVVIEVKQFPLNKKYVLTGERESQRRPLHCVTCENKRRERRRDRKQCTHAVSSKQTQ